MFRIGLPRRKWLLLLTSALATLLWFAAGVTWPRGRATPDANLIGGAALRPELAGAVGVNLAADELARLDLDATLAGLAADGIRWVRFTIPWDQVEPVRGQFAWAAWDRVFAALAQHPDLRPLVVLDGSPAWARTAADADNPLAPPHERADFGAYAAAVARRYGGQIRYYQVWHEPNIAPHWGSRPADPTDYAGLLREGAVQIRAADAASQIVLAALAPTTETGGANLSDVSYLDALYALGARAWFDVVAAEPYGFSQDVAAPASASALNFARVTLLRQVMLRHGDAATPVWATAFGWNALPADWAGQPSPWGQVTEAGQTRNAADAIQLSATRWPWLGPLFWTANCPSRPADDPWLGFALCAADGAPRPVRQALAAAAQTPAVLPPGDHATDHPALRYGSGWRITPQAADPSADGDVLTFTFYGAELSLRVQGGPYWAYYRISVDGQPANALPRDERGAAYLVLHDPLAATRVAAVATGLPTGPHEARVEAVGGWGQWALRGVLVSATPPVNRPWLPRSLAALALLASALGVILAWPWWRAALGWLTATSDRTAALPGVILWAAAIGLALIFAWSRWLPLDLVSLAGLGLLFLICPALALPLIAAAIPFWPAPKLLAGWTFSVYELFIWVAVGMRIAYCVLRIAYCGSRATRRVSRFTFHVSRLPSLDWPVLALLIAGFLATLAADRAGVAWREFRTVFLDGALFYWLITRVPGHTERTQLEADNRAGRAAAAPADENRADWTRGFSRSVSQREKPAEASIPMSQQAIVKAGFSYWPLVNGLLVGMVAVSALALWQLATGQGRIDVEGVWRVRGLYGSPNNLALVLDRVVPLALALAAFGAMRRENAAPGIEPLGGLVGERLAKASIPIPERPILRADAHAARGAMADENVPQSAGLRQWWRPRQSSGLRYRAIFRAVLLSLAALLTGAACLATFSKGALLLGLPAGIGAVLLGGAWRTRRRWPLWALAALAIAGGVALLMLFRTPRFADLLNFQTGTSFFRVKLWQAAWQMGLDHPWLGVGPDNFLYAYRTRYVLPSAWQELNLSHPHNLLLDLWTRLGMIGVLAGGWALVAAFRRGWRLFRSVSHAAGDAMADENVGPVTNRPYTPILRTGDAATWPLALGLLAGLAATVAHGLIDNSLFLVDLMALFMLALGVLQRLGQAGDARSETGSSE